MQSEMSDFDGIIKAAEEFYTELRSIQSSNISMVRSTNKQETSSCVTKSMRSEGL